jgi:hypothetical protein
MVAVATVGRSRVRSDLRADIASDAYDKPLIPVRC